MHKIWTVSGLILFLAVFSVAVPQSVFASCINGLPCVTSKHDNPSSSIPQVGSPACDANFMNQIYAKSFLEANRQNTMNQVVVRKPDSVLQYTCFDKFASDAAQNAGFSFSESTLWTASSVPIGSNLNDQPVTSHALSVNQNGALDNAISTLTLSATKDYVDQNYSYEMLGGRPTLPKDDISNTVSNAPYFCDMLTSVWEYAKCDNFAAGDDAVLSLETLAGLNPRTEPLACSGNAPHAIEQGHLDLADNKDFDYVSFDPVIYMRDGAPSATLDFFTTGDECLPPVETGVSMRIVETEKDVAGNENTISEYIYPDKICPTPGCFYNQTKDECIKAP